jgi:hypothetical protein
MKQILIFSLTVLSFTCFGQFKKNKGDVAKDSLKTVVLSPMQESKILELDKLILELQQKQREFLEFIFDANMIDPKTVKTVRYDKGKILYTLNE